MRGTVGSGAYLHGIGVAGGTLRQCSDAAAGAGLGQILGFEEVGQLLVRCYHVAADGLLKQGRKASFIGCREAGREVLYRPIE
jgi:hypothetical protein